MGSAAVARMSSRTGPQTVPEAKRAIIHEERHPLHWLPNALTVSRILAVPALVAGILTTAAIERVGWLVPWRATLGLFLLCMATDFLDGWLARRWKLVSGFGRMIDPIADKLLVAGCLVALSVVADGAWWLLAPALAVIGRDILVSGAREHAALSNIVMSPTRLAKWKTAFEMVAIAVLIVWTASRTWLPIGEGVATAQGVLFGLGIGALWLAAALSVWTGAGYVREALEG